MRLALIVAMPLLFAGCAEPPTDPDALAAFNEANDPFEPANRDIFEFNLFLDDHIAKPVAEAYRVVPEELRHGLHNMIVTVHTPAVFGNYLLQGETNSAAETVLRFLINITAGVGGFFDVASMTGVPSHDTDFGVTLAKWGMGEEFYLMLPLFGPSNPRDAIGLAVDSFMDPVGYYATLIEQAARFAFEGIDKREPLIEPLDELRRTSVDYYATLRSLYRQHRADQIRSGKGGANFPAPSISEKRAPAPAVPEAAAPAATVPTAAVPAAALPVAALPVTAIPVAEVPVAVPLAAAPAPAAPPAALPAAAVETASLRPVGQAAPDPGIAVPKSTTWPHNEP